MKCQTMYDFVSICQATFHMVYCKLAPELAFAEVFYNSASFLSNLKFQGRQIWEYVLYSSSIPS